MFIKRFFFMCCFLTIYFSLPQDAYSATITDVEASFRQLEVKGKLIQYSYDASRAGDKPDGYTSGNSHFQGIQPLNKQGYYAVSGSGKDAGHLFILEKEGTDWGSVVAVVNVSTDSKFTTAHHAGGLQVWGDYLVVALEIEEGKNSKVVFYDVSDPTNPKYLYSIDRVSIEAGAVGITKMSNGKFLLAVGRNNSNIIDFYTSKKDTLSGNLPFNDEDKVTWKENDLESIKGMDTEFGNYQNLNLLTDSSGEIYLVGMHRNSATSKDWADLFKIDVENSKVTVTKLQKKHMYCTGLGSMAWEGMDAGAGIAINGNNGLNVYAVSLHFKNRVIQVNEFNKFRDLAIPPKTGWVKLWDDKNYSDRMLSISSDKKIPNYKNIYAGGKKGFGDKVSSVKWSLPSGTKYVLYENDNYRGKSLVLKGTGSYSNLKHQEFNDKISSSRAE